MMPGTMGGAKSEEHSIDRDTAMPRRALALTPIATLKTGSVPIELRDKVTAVAARRLGQGRVLQVGYTDTWRWRMGGIDDPVQSYRDWWSTMVSSIAFAPRTPLPVSTTVEPTPMASLVSILGRPTSKSAPVLGFLNDPRLLPILFGLLMATLFLEWASRRLRGQP